MSGEKRNSSAAAAAPLPDVIQRLLPLTKQSEDYIWRPAREAIAEIERLRAKIEVDDMWRTFGWDAPNPQDADFADDLREFLSGQADAEYFTDDSAPHPNEAMKLLVRLNGLFPEGDDAGEKAGLTQAAEGSEPSSELFQRLRMAAMKLDLDPVGDLINEAAGELLRLKSLNAELREGLEKIERAQHAGDEMLVIDIARSLLSRTT